ncbi:uncharacterized protein LOC130736117 [Lotus japonicus]|uniref:uncharacterized protein LOC130736117 n=1 Tax=Lotus japonicus TaxID=34305 RepID=UPI00258A3437|nr:uncharacterized protein LOC130736117 [Lotus japonicus]
MEEVATGPHPIGQPPEETARKATFKEKVLGAQTAGFKEVRNLVKDGFMKREQVWGSRLFPHFDFIDDADYMKICKPFEQCLVIKLLGKRIGYNILYEKLRALWKPAGGFELKDIHHGYFLVQFDLVEDRAKVMAGAPWMIFDHYLSVKPWTPEFVAANSKINTTMAWIHIPGLGFQFYDESILVTLASGVGKSIQVDTNTMDMQRGKFARICVEIDLDQPVIGMVGLRGTWYNVEYEVLHLLCSHCGCYGHMARQCANPPQPVAPDSTPAVVTTPATTTEIQAQGSQQENVQPTVMDAVNAQGTMSVDGGGINGAAIKPVKSIPLTVTAHGEWLVVDKRKKNPSKTKQGNNTNSMRGPGKNGKNLVPVITAPKLVQPLVFASGSTTEQINKGATINNGKKRTRREPTHDGNNGKSLAHDGKVTTTNNSLGNNHMPQLPTHTTRMIGTTRVFTLADGAQSTIAMQHQGGSRYTVLMNEEQEHGSSFETGQHSGVPPEAARK